MEFDESLLNSNADLTNVGLDDLRKIHEETKAEADKYSKLLLENASNKTQKTKAKKSIKDINFKLSFYQNKEIQEWKALHPDYTSDNEDESSDEDVSPEDLLKHISEVKIEDKPAQDQMAVPKGPKKNRQKERKLRKQAEMEEQRKQAELEASQLPDLKKIEKEELDKKCVELNLVQEEIMADGNCLFYSIVNQLKARHTSDLFDTYQIPKTFTYHNKPDLFSEHLSQKLLRELVVSYLQENKDTYQYALFNEATDDLYDFDEYCSMMKDTSAWGGEVELSIITQIFQCRISIMQQQSSFEIGDSSLPNPVLKLVYYKHTLALGEHYASLIDK